MFRLLLACGMALSASAAWAQGAVATAPPGDWVKPVPLPTTSHDTAAPVRLLLQDQETRFGPDGDETYGEIAIKFQAPEGLAAGAISVPWNPETSTLTVHKVQIIRGGQVIDVLAAGQTFTVLRRETNLERATLDGVLTAAMQPEGLQVGDVLDYAFTMKRHDPALQGRSQLLAGDLVPLQVERLRIRELWPAAKPMRWKSVEGLGPAKVTKTADGTELVIDMTNAERPKPPKQAPSRFSIVGLIETTEFADWSDVAAIMTPLYDKAATLKPGSALNEEIAKLRASSPDPAIQAAAALRLVQDQVRYVYLGINDGGYVPASADQTWARRFGDCKGKTVLLIALLHGLGIQAQPELVASRGGDGMDARLPSMQWFDHVLVRAVIAGKTYWLDGTRSGDRALASIVEPDFGWGLPVQPAGAKLERLVPPPPETPLEETRIRIDASAGIAAPAPAHLETVLRGDAATLMRVALSMLSETDREKHLRDYWSGQYDWIDIKSVNAAYDDATGEERLSMDGSAKMAWSARANGVRQYETDGSSLGWRADFSRDPGPHQDAPFAVTFPHYERTLETIVLPRGGDGFTVSSPDVDETAAGRAFHRKAAIANGLFTMEASTRSLEPEFPMAETKAAEATLKKLADDTLYLLAPSWYRATDAELAYLTKVDPTDADGFLARAQAFEQQGDFTHALADAQQALSLKPHDAGMLNSRCFLRAEANKDLDGALADCNEALSLAPRDPPTLDSRGFVYFRMGQYDRALADYDAALDVDQTIAPSLYIRGLIRQRQGDQKGGEADIAAAKKLDPGVAADYARLGVAR